MDATTSKPNKTIYATGQNDLAALIRLRRLLEGDSFASVTVIYIAASGSPKRRRFTACDLQAIRQRICYSV